MLANVFRGRPTAWVARRGWPIRFGSSLVASAIGAVMGLETLAAQSRNRTPLDLPVTFYRVEAPELGSATDDRFDLAAMQQQVDRTNGVWAPCGVRLVTPRIRAVRLPSVTAVSPTEREVADELRAMYAELGVAVGSSPFHGYLEFVAANTALVRRLAAKVFGAPLDEVGTSELPVVVVPYASVIRPGLPPSISQGKLSRAGLRALATRGTEDPEVERMYSIVWGREVAPPTPGEGEVPTDVLAHELGHFLRLPHRSNANLMGARGNALDGAQCDSARRALQAQGGGRR